MLPDSRRSTRDGSTHDSAQRSTAEAVIAGIDAPQVLTDRIEEAIGAVAPGQSLATASPEELLQAAESLFGRALATGCTERTSAVALLVVDALVTYAFERASDNPSQVETRAARAIAMLAGLAGG
jgi:hypothetical protein